MKLDEINQKYDFMKDVCFEHQDGWAKIIDEMCSSLKYFFDLSKDNYGFTILQIKEKFGKLVIYFSLRENISQEARNIIKSIVRQTEINSHTVCEKCGAYGEFRNTSSWVHTYCDNCEKEYNRRA